MERGGNAGYMLAVRIKRDYPGGVTEIRAQLAAAIRTQSWGFTEK